MRILDKLCSEDFLHFLDLYPIPIGPLRNLPSQNLGIVGIQFRKKQPIFHFCTLCCLIGCLGTEVFQPVHLDTGRVEVA